jgi:GT2 family glycosyltransferase
LAGERQHVVAVVCSYNGKEDTLRCVASLAEQDHAPLTTLVVDNRSTDGTVEAVREHHPHAEILAMEENQGVAGAYHAGLRRALELGADYGMVLNNDMWFAPDMVSAMVDEAAKHPDLGAMSPLIYFADPPDVIWYAGSQWTPRLPYNGTMTGFREPDRGQYATVTRTGTLTGAIILAPRAAIEATDGGPDPTFFYLFCDVDWSLRLREAGYGVYFVPQARAWHRVSAAHGEYSPNVAYYGTRNNLEVVARHAGRTGPRAQLRLLATAGVHLFHSRRGDDPKENAKSVLAGWRDFRAGRLGKRDG